jgi:hypothetical protein
MMTLFLSSEGPCYPRPSDRRCKESMRPACEESEDRMRIHNKEKGDRLGNTLNIHILLSFGGSGSSPMYGTSFGDY